MSNYFEPPTSGLASADSGTPPKPPSRGMWLLAILGVLVLYYAITGTSPDILSELLVVGFAGTGLFVVGRWITQQVRYMIRRNGGLHLDGLR